MSNLLSIEDRPIDRLSGYRKKGKITEDVWILAIYLDIFLLCSKMKVLNWSSMCLSVGYI